MNSNRLNRLSSISLGLAFTSTFLTVAPSQASIISYNFQVPIAAGNLTGNIYQGILSYNNDLLTGLGSESLSIAQGTTVSFSFLGTDYTQADDSNTSVDFFDGQFLGLNFSVIDDASFSFSSAIPNILPAQFTYLLIDDAGGGIVEYALASESIPEPTSLVGLLTVGMIGLAALLKRQTIALRK